MAGHEGRFGMGRPVGGTYNEVRDLDYYPTHLALSKIELGSNIRDFRSNLEHLKRFSTPASNNIARGEALDLLIKSGEKKARFLVYPSNQEDQDIFKLLEKSEVPQLQRLAYDSNPDLTVIKVPTGAYRLDSIDFIEQIATQGLYTGAVEIMKKLGDLLKDAKSATGMFPLHHQIGDFAFVTGDRNYIKLIPPYKFDQAVTAHDVVSSIAEELDTLDPDHEHDSQVQALESSINNLA